MSPATSPTVILIPITTVVERTLFCEQHVRRLVRQGRFPKPVRLGSGPHGRVGWVASEIEEWLQARVAERDQRVRELEAV